MRFQFDEKKAAQAAAFLINRHDGTLNYMALIKLLYLADRQALIQRGLPITGDRWFSMPHGPVLSQVLNLINMGKEPGVNGTWFDYVPDTTGYDVVADPDATTEELSEFELDLLSQIDERYGAMGPFDLRDLTHALPEWQDPDGSSIRIEPADVLRAEDFSEEDIRALHEEAEDLWFVRRVVSSGEHR